MSDPTTTVAGAVTAGAVTAVFTSLGLEPQPVFWALVGAAIGVSAAPASSKARSVILFVTVVLACSLLGSAAAQGLAQGTQIQRNAAACFLAMVFHPLSAAVIQALPGFVNWLLNWRRGGT
jgi:hypothetical protein